MTSSAPPVLGKLPTGISGLDNILSGGIPELSITIIAGAPGSGKTIFTQQLMYANVNEHRKALYLTTLSEPAIKMLHFLQKFTFFRPEYVGRHVIYQDIGETMLEKGPEETVRTILQSVEAHKPTIVVVDGFKAIHDMAENQTVARKFGYELSIRLATWGATTFFVGEYAQEETEREPIFSIADGIIRLQSQAQGLHYQRYLDVVKMRGEHYFTGLHPFTISAAGLAVYPRIKTPEFPPDYTVSTERISTGLTALDAMLHGGLPAGTTTMVAGGAGTGKTLLGLHFIVAGAARGEAGVFVTLQEQPAQLRAIAQSFGWDLQALERQGLLVHLYHSSVELQPDIHAELIKTMVRSIGARRVVIDPISDIEMATPNKVRYKDYIYSLVNEFRMQNVTTLLTSEIAELFGPLQLSEHGVSFIADNVILLRYVELFGRIGRALSIMKVRGSQHSKEIREFEITNDGMRIGLANPLLTGIMGGMPTFRGSTTLAALPLVARHIVETLNRHGAMTLQHLRNETGITSLTLEREIVLLQQQGIIIASERDGTVFYTAML